MCPEREVELILWCRWGVAVYKREKFFKDGTYDVASDEYSDWLGAAWWTARACPDTSPKLDPEVVSVTNNWGETIIKAVAVYDTSTNPPTVILYDQLLWTVLTWYTVVTDNTATSVVVWEPRCDAGVTIIPFYDVETNWAPSWTIAFWLNAITWAVVVPSGAQRYWPCVVAPTVLADINCATANPNVKECNSGAILTALQAIQTNTATSNTNELNIITELQAIKVQVIAVNANTDWIETRLDTIITDQLAWNTTLTNIKSVLDNSLIQLQAINANTDTVEALITSTNTKLDTLIAELDIEQYETAPIPVCVTNAWISTTRYTFERVQFNSELGAETSRVKLYKNETNIETPTAPTWIIEEWACSILKKYEWNCWASIPAWFDKYELNNPITVAAPTTNLSDFYVAGIQTDFMGFK